MKYRLNNDNKLKILKSDKNKKDNYWLSIDFKWKDLNDDETKILMTFRAFIKYNNIINKSMTIIEGDNVVYAYTHYHDDDEEFDESNIKVGCQTQLKPRYNEDEIVLDNCRITDEEEKIILEELFKNNGIIVDIDPFLEIYQISMRDLLYLTREDIPEEEKRIIYRHYKRLVDRITQEQRHDNIRQKWIKEKIHGKIDD